MNKRIKETLDSWDVKSFVLTILILSIGLVAWFYLADIRDRFRTNEEEKYKGQTKGEIVEIKKADRITQSRWNGTRIFVDSYSVSYRYEVNGQKFESTDVISVTEKNQKLLKEILERGSNNICFIKFDKEEPQKSLLVASQ